MEYTFWINLPHHPFLPNLIAITISMVHKISSTSVNFSTTSTVHHSVLVLEYITSTVTKGTLQYALASIHTLLKNISLSIPSPQTFTCNIPNIMPDPQYHTQPSLLMNLYWWYYPLLKIMSHNSTCYSWEQWRRKAESPHFILSTKQSRTL